MSPSGEPKEFFKSLNPLPDQDEMANSRPKEFRFPPQANPDPRGVFYLNL